MPSFSLIIETQIGYDLFEAPNEEDVITAMQLLDAESGCSAIVTYLENQDDVKYERLEIDRGTPDRFKIIYRRYENREFLEHLMLYDARPETPFQDVYFIETNGSMYVWLMEETIDFVQAQKTVGYFMQHRTIDRAQNWHVFNISGE